MDGVVQLDGFSGVLDTLERFTRERLIPREAEVEETDAVPADIIAEMRDLGLFGLSIPLEYGGMGLGMEEEALAQMVLSRASAAFRFCYGSNVGIGSKAITLDGTTAQKERWLPRLATGELVGCFALTEPDVGSDAAAIRTTARRDGDDYVLDGTKRYITNADRADLFTVMARTGAAASRAAGISAFLVERGTPGLSVGRPDRKMGLRGSRICDVVLDGCRVPATALIGGCEGQGFKTAMRVLDRGRVNVAAWAVGAARRLIDEAAAYASVRRQFGQPIGGFQLVQALLADSEVEYLAARAMVLDVARAVDRGPAPMEAAAAKLFCSEMLGRVADRAVQVFGGAGYIAEYGVERMYRDARVLRIFEGTSQILQLVVARHLLARHAA